MLFLKLKKNLQRSLNIINMRKLYSIYFASAINCIKSVDNITRGVVQEKIMNVFIGKSGMLGNVQVNPLLLFCCSSKLLLVTNDCCFE